MRSNEWTGAPNSWEGKRRALTIYGDRMWHPRNPNERAALASPMKPSQSFRDNDRKGRMLAKRTQSTMTESRGSRYREKLEQELTNKKRNWRKF